MEQTEYTRERMGELGSLIPGFIANVKFGNSTFGLDSLKAVYQAISCSSDYLHLETALTARQGQSRA